VGCAGAAALTLDYLARALHCGADGIESGQSRNKGQETTGKGGVA
jgi:hypothetical protein